MLKATTPCAIDDYRAFDFWLGSWDVTVAGASAPTAVNHITTAQDGCVVLEDYTNNAFSGRSINFNDQQTGKWHQSWMGNGGGAVYLEGGLSEKGEMVPTDAELPAVKATNTINLVTWTPLSDGRVRQH
ncbi:hypothetical protein [Parasphingorhabdus halotolerans]|uniref:Uncharacterized protein n=1 Tax=Parasphingorhabdus halotolerans TaxID=2725558 RepID=A0A6H2DLI2_9SPHN|nr:hypothetical protein [Parasphingorhabdus halotolerans]QJB68843.1 hypothetical protein HF685_05755 [Parasphingorhabdus halotolerans]